MTNPAVEALNPCPFCGSLPKLISEEENHWWIVSCSILNNGCGAFAGYRFSREKAIEAWNRRAQAEQTPVAEVAKAGRVVSEELFQKLITWFGPPWPTPTDAELISALRIAPVYHKEES